MINPEILSLDGKTINIRFPEKPSGDIRYRLKNNGFSWSPKHTSWFAASTPRTQSVVKSLFAKLPLDKIIEGDCIELMRQMPAKSVDLVVTDPPYLVNYKDRFGRSILNDNDDYWVSPAFSQLYRLLKPNSFCVSFCGWSSIDLFVSASKQAGFQTVGQLVWQKDYASSSFYISIHHEQAIVLAKGTPEKPSNPLKSVLPWSYSGNKLHPTQKHVDVIAPLVETFSNQGETVLDPFCGSGTTAVAAHELGRHYIGIEKAPEFAETARQRLSG
ncbi:MAG: DNA methyltransferase [Candidatus Thiodiazotropha sp.]